MLVQKIQKTCTAEHHAFFSLVHAGPCVSFTQVFLLAVNVEVD